MKRLLPILLLSTAAQAAEPARITLTVESLEALKEDYGQVIAAFAPPDAEVPGIEEWIEDLGIPIEHVDPALPWQVEVHVGMDPQLAFQFGASLRIPVSELRISVADLARDSSGVSEITKAGSYARLWFGDLEAGVPGRQSHLDWHPGKLDPPESTLSLNMRLGHEVRDFVQGQMQMARGMLAMFTASEEAKAGGMDPELLARLYETYMDMWIQIVDGMQSVDVLLSVEDGVLAFEERISPVPGSALAGMLKPGKPIGAVARYLDPHSAVGLVVRYEGSPEVREMFQEITRIGLEMNRIDTDDPIHLRMEEMLEKYLPMEFALSVDFSDGIPLSGAYHFEGEDAGEAREEILDMAEAAGQLMVGEGKPYSSFKIERAVERIQDIEIDRFSFEINPDRLGFQIEDEAVRERMERFLGEGEQSVLMAIAGDDTILSATPDRMEALIGRGDRDTAPELGPSTMFQARIAPVRIARQLFPGSRVARLDPLSDLVLRLDLDGTMAFRLEIPLSWGALFALQYPE